VPPLDEDRSWAMNGTIAMGRSLLNAMPVGTWTFLAAHYFVPGSQVEGFSGFSLKTLGGDNFADGELLRFGYVYNLTGAGLYVSDNSGERYFPEECTYYSGDTLLYSITWHGNGTYTLSVENKSTVHNWSYSTQGTMGLGSVAMLGTAIYGGTGESLVFDAYKVVPEPAAALPLFALATLATVLRRTRTNSLPSYTDFSPPGG